MRPSELVEFLEALYLRKTNGRFSVVLLGPPGVGKTATVKLVAERIADKLGLTFHDLAYGIPENDNNFIFYSFSLLHADPVDFMGVPRANTDGSVTFMLPDVMAYLTRRGVKGILFIDEFTLDSRPDRRAALLKLVDEGYLGYRKVSDDLMIVLAGNTRQWSTLAEELDEPMRRGRAIVINVESPTIDDWVSWMDYSYPSWDRRIAAFLKLYPDTFFSQRDEREDDGYTPLACPRSWARVALLTTNLPHEAVAKSLLPPRTAALLSTFLTTAIPPIREVFKAPRKWLELKTEAKYLLLSQAVSKVDEEFIDAASEWLRLLSESDRESLALLVSLMPKTELVKFLKLVSKRLPMVFRALTAITKSVGDLL